MPTMIIFHDDKAFSKFNASQWSIKNFINFVNNVTGHSMKKMTKKTIKKTIQQQKFLKKNFKYHFKILT